jgi:hypothetical protein
MKKSEILHEYFSRLARKSVAARMENLPPEERSRIASEAAKARWSRTKTKATRRKK